MRGTLLLLCCAFAGCDDGEPDPALDRRVQIDGALDASLLEDVGAPIDMAVVLDATPPAPDRGAPDMTSPLDRGIERDLGPPDMAPAPGRRLLRATVRLNLGPARGELTAPFRAEGGGLTLTGRLR